VCFIDKGKLFRGVEGPLLRWGAFVITAYF
jgi:hypothetical protein